MKTRVEAFDQAIIADVMDAPAIRASFARDRLAEAQQQNRAALGEVPDHNTFVDGMPSEVLEKVRPDGRIIFEFEIGSGVVAWIFAALTEASPVLTGKYRKSHTIYADGIEVENPTAAENAEEIVILSLVPYARKIEGNKRRPPQSAKAIKGVYQVIETMAKRRFGNLAHIKFTYMNPIGGASDLVRWAGRNASQAQGSKKQDRQMQKNLRQPALLIRFR